MLMQERPGYKPLSKSKQTDRKVLLVTTQMGNNMETLYNNNSNNHLKIGFKFSILNIIYDSLFDSK